MKLFIKFIAIYTLLTVQVFAIPSYADKYQDEAEKYVSSQGAAIKEHAKSAAVSQFTALVGSLLSGQFSSSQINEQVQLMNEALNSIRLEVLDSLRMVHEAPVAELDVRAIRGEVKLVQDKITSLEGAIFRLSWAVQDNMDKLTGAHDWFYQSIEVFKQRCSLGYFNPAFLEEAKALASPPDFETDLSFFVSMATEFGAEEEVEPSFQTHVAVNPENYADDAAVKFLTDSAGAAIQGASLAGSAYLLLPAKVAAVKVGVVGTVGSAIGSAAMTLGMAGAAIALAVYLVGSFKAYKEQKRWARAEMYKFYHVLDSDDFSKVYREECASLSDKLGVLSSYYEKYNSNMEYRANIDKEIFSVNFKECTNYLKLKERGEGEFEISEGLAEGAFKYYHCATKAHGPKIVKQLISSELSALRSKIEILRSYLVDLIDTASEFESDFSHLLVASAYEVKIDRLYKEMIISATGLILDFTSLEQYKFHRRKLVKALGENDESLFFHKVENIRKGIRRADSHVEKYTLIQSVVS